MSWEMAPLTGCKSCLPNLASTFWLLGSMGWTLKLLGLLMRFLNLFKYADLLIDNNQHSCEEEKINLLAENVWMYCLPQLLLYKYINISLQTAFTPGLLGLGIGNDSVSRLFLFINVKFWEILWHASCLMSPHITISLGCGYSSSHVHLKSFPAFDE